MPDPIDSFAMLVFLVLAIGMPLLGWFFMVADYRAHLRSFRRAIAVVKSYYRTTPTWIHQAEWIGERPECLQSLDLTMPCNREEVLAAYRQKVKEVHPDRGGDRRQFDRLQKHLEEALALVEANRLEQSAIN